MPDRNVIVIMTDELRRDALGCYGNPIVQTPRIDALAARGQRFDAAYTPSPICVPARASIATGRYVHETGCWANAQPYCGTPVSWHHVLRDAGREVVSVGKLHFRSEADDNGFSREIRPLHVHGGQGWVHGLLRDELDLFDATGFARHIGPGEDSYSTYDEAVCRDAVDWLSQKAAAPAAAPWGLFVSFLRPHYPLTCPKEYYDLYDPAEMPMPRPAGPESGADHPVLRAMRQACDYDAPFTDETRRIAVASYYGLVSFVDALVGRIIAELQRSGLDRSTTIIFTSDHGECLGDRGFWTKMVMYEEAAAVPLIMAGPGIAPGACAAPVSLIDLFPTILELAGVSAPPSPPPHARSLLQTKQTPEASRLILSEYHDYGAVTGMFLCRKGPWKLVSYPGYASQLFNLEQDPGETCDLAPDPAYAELLAELLRDTRRIADPAEINARAFAAQAERIESLGGRDAIKAMTNFDHTPVR